MAGAAGREFVAQILGDERRFASSVCGHLLEIIAEKERALNSR